jgi:hypothetical protein
MLPGEASSPAPPCDGVWCGPAARPSHGEEPHPRHHHDRQRPRHPPTTRYVTRSLPRLTKVPPAQPGTGSQDSNPIDAQSNDPCHTHTLLLPSLVSSGGAQSTIPPLLLLTPLPLACVIRWRAEYGRGGVADHGPQRHLPLRPARRVPPRHRRHPSPRRGHGLDRQGTATGTALDHRHTRGIPLAVPLSQIWVNLVALPPSTQAMPPSWVLAQRTVSSML